LSSFAFFAIRQKTLGKKANKGFALNPLRARRPFMAVGVVELWVSYAKETWVSLAGGFYVVIRFAFLRNDRAFLPNGPKLGVGARFWGRNLPKKRNETHGTKINCQKVFEEREKLFSKSFSHSS